MGGVRAIATRYFSAESTATLTETEDEEEMPELPAAVS